MEIGELEWEEMGDLGLYLWYLVEEAKKQAKIGREGGAENEYRGSTENEYKPRKNGAYCHLNGSTAR